MVRREVYKEKEYPLEKEAKKVLVPTYFYPVNSAIFVEDISRNH